MANQLQLRRGTKIENDLFTGATAEPTYETDRGGVRIHDGVTEGGRKLPFSELTQSEVDAKIVTKVASVSDLASANLVAGQAVELVRYHKWDGIPSVDYKGPKGGGGGVVEMALHNGGTAISLTRAFPTDWNNKTQLTAWFADGVTDEWCLVRPSDGVVDVKKFGAIENQVSTMAIQKTFDSVRYASVVGDFLLDAAVFPKSNSVIDFVGTLTASQIITTDECLIKLKDASNITLNLPSADCGSFAANSGIIVRENTSNITINSPFVVNAVWDVVRGGGRGLIIEANTGTQGRIIVNDIKCDNVDTVLGIQGYTGFRNNHIKVNGVVGTNSEKLLAIFGNGAGYPHSGDNLSAIISDVTGYNIAQPVRFDKGSNVHIDNMYVMNDSAYGPIGNVVKGVSSNVTIDNLTYEGDCVEFYSSNPWDDSGASIDEGYDVEKCKFDFKHKGNVSGNFLASGYSGSSRIKQTEINIFADTLSASKIATPQFANFTSLYLDIFIGSLNSKVKGFSPDVSQQDLSTYSEKVFHGSTFYESGTFTPTIVGSTVAGVGTYSMQSGSYTVIADRVFYNVYLTWTSHNGTGSMRVGNLPFTNKDDDSANSAQSLAFLNSVATSADTIPMAFISKNVNYISLTQSPVGGGSVTNIDMDSAGSLMVSGSFLL